MKIDFSKLAKKSNDSDDSQWLPVSDLMSGLMILFLFIAVSFALNVRKIAENYQDNQDKIYQALKNEFQPNLDEWKAKIDKDSLTFIFTDPEVLFATGKSDLQPRFKDILEQFFPRYIKVIDEYKSSINEVRIEGHTSSKWNMDSNEDEAYFKNMNLSQERTRSVLEYTYNLSDVAQYRSWIKAHFSAVGLSSSQPIKDKYGNEDENASKRVTFKIITNAEEQLQKILGAGQ
ncbi:OmpA/MotB family protein [Haemophilus paracuniculus]|nr:OmpA family protein [Haemophilus paracuniculus]